MKSIYKDILFVREVKRMKSVNLSNKQTKKKNIITRCAVNFRETVFSDVNM